MESVLSPFNEVPDPGNDEAEFGGESSIAMAVQLSLSMTVEVV